MKMDINSVTAMSAGKLSSEMLLKVETYGTIAASFKVLYLTAAEVAELRGGLDNKQWYGAMTEALRFTAHWPAHLHRLAPTGHLHAKIADVLIVER